MASSSRDVVEGSAYIEDEELHSDASEDEQEQPTASSSSTPVTSSKKKKKKSKARAALSKMKAGLSSVAIPQEMVDAVMEKVKEEDPQSQVDKAEIIKQMKAMQIMDILSGKKALGGKGKKDMGEHKFWSTQPVPQIGEQAPEDSGPIEPSVPRDQVRQEAYALPKDFQWVTVDMKNEAECKEVYELLSANYVEDDDASFRFAYTASFLRWALMPPGYHPSWHVGVRVTSSKKLVGFISGVPLKLNIRDQVVAATEINFLCVHKKLRSKRLAPVLIKEVTRRVHLEGVFQAIYTAGVVLPTPVSTCRYYHRTLNLPKLVDVGFTSVPRSMTLARLVRQTALPKKTALPGLREMESHDIPEVEALMIQYMKRFDMIPVFTRGEIEHTFLSGKGTEPMINAARRTDQVVWAYVVETDGKITDFFSFYTLPSSVIGNTKGHKMLEAAYLFYYATDAPEPDLKKRLYELVGDALIIARDAEFDVFNALTLMDNWSFLEDHKFGKGDGLLNFYLYNWRTPLLEGHNPLAGGKGVGRGIGVVML
ncbi:N-myristoyl transferase [Calocera viscosa TUFC12733]|uniref:Glycylpeptide N-tetradecanoyltransferase n=1 Tax=Calocera viscosa (strain TUFC12733) TaxID=1330018 RepID=A0A167NM62_CALVF|nr:N-myristoyl transferase [Calocera viscosa TUFC12733]